MRIYLIRHGETIYNQKGCYYGVTDAPLNETGRKQVSELVSYFKTIDLDAAVSSPLLRARQTAQIILDGRDLRLESDERLQEQNFGIFEGYTHQELTRKFPEEYAAWNQNFNDYRIPEGESFRDVRERVDQFVEGLPVGDGTLLLTAHKGTLGHFAASVLHLPLDGYWNFVFDQGCYSCIDLEDGYAIIRCLNRKPVA